MSMLSSAVSSAPATLVLEAEEQLRELPMPPIMYGAIALGVVFALLLVVWLFRHTAQAAVDGQRRHHSGDAHHGNADVRDSGAGH